MKLDRILDQLELHEGFRAKPYLDTEGNWTVGIGYNLTGRGLVALNEALGTKFTRIEDVVLTRDQGRKMCTVDVNRIHRAIPTFLPEYANLNDARQHVCIDMSFNMGFKAAGFKKAIDAVKRADWTAAAKQLFQSKWAGQVGDGEGKKFDRADRLSKMLLTGQDFTQ